MLGCHTPQIITTNIQLESPQQWTAVRKRPHELVDHDFSDRYVGIGTFKIFTIRYNIDISSTIQYLKDTSYLPALRTSDISLIDCELPLCRDVEVAVKSISYC